jgi:drug/metabolite transporter (DMT)-like permease
MTHFRAVMLMILVTFLWSLAGIVSRQLESTSSFEVTFWRSAFNALTLSVLLTGLRGRGMWFALTAAPRIVWLSGLCWAAMFTAFMMALTLTSVANVLVIMAFGPLLTTLLARIWLSQRIATITWLAMLAASLGMTLMFANQLMTGVSMTGSIVALAVPAAAAINWNILQRQRSAGPGVAPDMLPAVLIGACLSALATLPLAWPFQATAADLGWLAFLGAFQLALPCLLVVRLARVLSSPEIALLGLLEVVFGIALAWLGAGEQPTTATLAGSALVIGALLMNEFVRLGQSNPVKI